MYLDSPNSLPKLKTTLSLPQQTIKSGKNFLKVCVVAILELVVSDYNEYYVQGLMPTVRSLYRVKYLRWVIIWLELLLKSE